MYKRFFAVTLALLLVCGLISCADSDKTDPIDSNTGADGTIDSDTLTDDTNDVGNADDGEHTDNNDGTEQKKTLLLNSSTKGIKLLGERSLESDSQINCDWTCSGIEFTVDSLGGDIIVEAGSSAPCYFRAYVDGVEWKNIVGSTYFTVSGRSLIQLTSIPEGTHTVRIIKVTGHTLARAQLYTLSYNGTIKETAPEDKELYIEFIGDSICFGWGIMGTHDGSYTGQDGSLSYPYLMAQSLEADYSITALSGQGLIFHSSNIPTIADGYLKSSPLRDKSADYSFARKADVVVINVGTNDFYNKEELSINEEAFYAAYRSFIETVRQKNGEDCKIVCVYNTMNDNFGDVIVDLCRDMGGQRAGIYTLKLSRAASGHPTADESVAYVETIKKVVMNAINGVITEKELISQDSGDGESVSYDDFYDFNSKQ